MRLIVGNSSYRSLTWIRRSTGWRSWGARVSVHRLAGCLDFITKVTSKFHTTALQFLLSTFESYSMQFLSLIRPTTLVLTSLSVAALVACGGGNSALPFQTLDGAQPLVIGHRGSAGVLKYPPRARPPAHGAKCANDQEAGPRTRRQRAIHRI